MKNIILFGLILPLSFIYSEEADPAQFDRSVFSYSQASGLPSQILYRSDVVILRDGSMLHGELDKVPTLLYGFGKIDLALNTTSVFSRVPNVEGKWQVLTRMGNRYVALAAQDSISIIASISNPDGTISKEAKIIPLNLIDLIAIKSRNGMENPSSFQLTFNNGDEAPVDIIDRELLYTTGRSHKSIKATSIVELSFDGKFQGKMKKNNGELTELEGIPENSLLSVVIKDCPGSLRLPWVNIAHLRQIDENWGIQVSKSSSTPTPPQQQILTNGEISIADVEFEEESTSLLTINEEPEVSELAVGEDFEMNSLEIPADETKESSDSEKGKKEEEYLFVSKVDQSPPQVLFPNPIESEVSDSSSHSQENREDSIDQNVNALIVWNDSKEELPSHTQEELEPSENAEITSGQMIYVKPERQETSNFYIQNTKVTNSEYKKFVDAVNYKPPIHWVNGLIPSGQEEEPVVNVSYKDAFLFSIWIGKRLPTEQELAIARETGAIIPESDVSINEWTATPYAPRNGDPSAGSLAHVIYGRSHPEPMQKKTFNTKTSFRLATFAQ